MVYDYKPLPTISANINENGDLIIEDNGEFTFIIDENGDLIISHPVYSDALLNDLFNINEDGDLIVNYEVIMGNDSYWGNVWQDMWDTPILSVRTNYVHPATDTGFFKYTLYGYTFDKIQTEIDNIYKNLHPAFCDESYLPLLARNVRLKRNPDWTTDYFRCKVLYYWFDHNLLENIENSLNCLGKAYSEDFPEFTVNRNKGYCFIASTDDENSGMVLGTDDEDSGMPINSIDDIKNEINITNLDPRLLPIFDIFLSILNKDDIEVTI